MKTTTDFLNLGSTGVNLIVDASNKTTSELINLAGMVSKHNGHLTLINCNNKTTSELMKIALTAPSNITIDLSCEKS